jgi:uncharacterized membrane protein YfcA
MIDPLDYERQSTLDGRVRGTRGAWAFTTSLIVSTVLFVGLLHGGGYVALFTLVTTVPASVLGGTLAVKGSRGSPDQLRLSRYACYILGVTWLLVAIEIARRVLTK